ncbi:MAG: FprA family A-type flavoprotein [Bacteroidaceae bacterium]|nr:FprA family A-type flavoprotein [Bacteroidaceae bacterium]
MKQLSDNIWYVGVNDRDKERFECLWPLPYGVSYNSYLVTGDRTALIDTVDSRFFPQFLAEVRAVLGNRPVDYLVINHMEPDHSGSIALVRSVWPDVCLVGNKKTLAMVQGYYGQAAPVLEVGEGSTLELGGPALQFTLTPMVHWPETMMTLETGSMTLFSGDAFGCFGSLDGGVLDTELPLQHYWTEMVRYYSNIVGKYGQQVQMALRKLGGTQLGMVCSTHGPVWTEHIAQVVDVYNRLSLYEGRPGATLVFGSMYGNTALMAESVAEGLVQGGVKDFTMHKLSRTDLSYLIADAFTYKGLLLGAPTYNNGLYPLMQEYVNELQGRLLKNRLVGCFGSFTWAGQAVRRLQEFATQPGMELVGQPVEMKQGFTAETAAQCRQLGLDMAHRLTEEA